MMPWLAVALGGAIGAVARYALAQLFPVAPGRFPFGTFSANLLGAFLMGVLFVLVVEKLVLPPLWRQFAMVGILGALTTYSTFALEVVHLLHGGHWKLAAGYALLTLLGCIAATYGGFLLLQKP